MSEWKTGTPRELAADLRVGGWAQGHSAIWPRFLRLHKTDLLADIRALPEGHVCIWQVRHPDNPGQHARPRRTVIVWLGK